MSYADVVKMLTQDVVNTIAKGETVNMFETGLNQSIFIEHGNYRATLVKRQGSNAWLMNAFELRKTDDDMAKSKDLTIPTHIKPTLHRQDVGAFDKISDGESRVGGYTSTPTHTKPTMTRLNVGASDKDSLIQDTQEFNQPRYSTLPKTTTELLKGLDKGKVSDGFNTHLDKLIQRVVSDYEARLIPIEQTASNTP